MSQHILVGRKPGSDGASCRPAKHCQLVSETPVALWFGAAGVLHAPSSPGRDQATRHSQSMADPSSKARNTLDAILGTTVWCTAAWYRLVLKRLFPTGRAGGCLAPPAEPDSLLSPGGFDVTMPSPAAAQGRSMVKGVLCGLARPPVA
jgi:hypothetical protein